MITIENKEIILKLKVLNEKGELEIKTIETSYFQQIETVCNKPLLGNSYTIQDMKSYNRLMKYFEGDKKEQVEIEDADFDYVKKHFNMQSWTINDMQIVEMVEYINDLESIIKK